MRAYWGSILLTGLAALAAGCTSPDDAERPSVDITDVTAAAEVELLEPDPTEDWFVAPEAERILKAAGDLLANAQRFSFKAEIMEEDVFESGAKIDTTREASVRVRHPNGLLAERRTAQGVRRLYYDGRSAALLDVDANLYALAEDAPPDLDGFLDFLNDELNVPIPMGDLLVADPYAALREPAVGGLVFDDALVRGVRCHHLGFGNGNIEWQIWVQAEGQPLIRKAVINYRDEPGSPRWEAHLSDWNLADDLPDAAFTFQPPAGSHRIKISPRDDGESDVATETETE